MSPDITNVPLGGADSLPLEDHWRRMMELGEGGTLQLSSAPFHGKMETGGQLSTVCVWNQCFGITVMPADKNHISTLEGP